MIRVHNQMEVEMPIHWHGILLPNAMDGVPFVTYPPIATMRNIKENLFFALVYNALACP